MEYFNQRRVPQGYSERIFIKVMKPKRIIELNMVKLDDESQVLFLFKEVSVYNKLSQAKTTEKFSNLLINSVAHNLYTPLNQLVGYAQMLKMQMDMASGMANQTLTTMGICLQRLMFTTNNILEMHMIRQKKFQFQLLSTNIEERIWGMLAIFEQEIKRKEIEI